MEVINETRNVVIWTLAVLVLMSVAVAVTGLRRRWELTYVGIAAFAAFGFLVALVYTGLAGQSS